MPFEAPVAAPPRPAEVVADFFRGSYLASTLVAVVFPATAPVAIALAVGARGGLTPDDLASWFFASFFVNGLITIAMSWRYRQPLVFFWTIPGMVLLGPAFAHASWAEIVGAFVVTGVLMLVLAFTGWVKRAMEAVPLPVVMGMVSGVFLKFGVDLVRAVRDDFWIAAPMVALFVALSASAAAGRRLPPLFGAILAGAIAVAVLGRFDPSVTTWEFAHPNFYMPVFSPQVLIELVVPLAITVLVVQNGQGGAVLTAAGHRPPINMAAAACGAGSIVTGFMGAASTCLTGPVSAFIVGAGGDKRGHYASAIVVGIAALCIGLASPALTGLMLATPPAFIAALAGLAMLRVLQTAFAVSFGGRFSLGALVSFLVTVADVPILTIGAPFWGLVFGFALSWLVERRDFEASRSA
jgi:benzoate membrane transport protein